MNTSACGGLRVGVFRIVEEPITGDFVLQTGQFFIWFSEAMAVIAWQTPGSCKTVLRGFRRQAFRSNA